jgi:hypothetical protein
MLIECHDLLRLKTISVAVRISPVGGERIACTVGFTELCVPSGILFGSEVEVTHIG